MFTTNYSTIYLHTVTSVYCSNKINLIKTTFLNFEEMLNKFSLFLVAVNHTHDYIEIVIKIRRLLFLIFSPDG